MDFEVNKRIALRRSSPCGTVGRLVRGFNRVQLHRVGDLTDPGAGRPNLKQAKLYRVGQSPACNEDSCILPNVALHTVGNWPENNVLTDISGNGGNLAVAIGAEVYDDLGACRGFRFSQVGSGAQRSSLIAPDSAIYRLAGEFTMQLTTEFRATYAQSLFACLNAAATSVMYDCFIDAAVNLKFFDNAGGRAFAPNVNLAAFSFDIPFELGIRRRLVSPGVYAVDAFVNHVFVGTTPALAPVSDGTERLTFGGFAGDAFGSRYSGSQTGVRLLDVALPDADM